MAPAGARPRHRPGHPPRARRAARPRAQRGLQRRLDEQNYRVREIAEIVGDIFGCEVSFGDSGGDNRSYRVDFEKIANKLPGFACEWDAVKGAQQLHDVFSSIDLDEATFTGRGHTRLKQLQHLITTRQLDDKLFWSAAMIITPTPIEGVAIIDLEQREDDRGFFARTFDAAEFAAAGLEPAVEQCNMSFNHKAGTLRGMHYQVAPHPEAKLVRCIRGAIVDVIVDMRPDSPTCLQHVAVELTADNRRSFYVPPYFAHGYLTLADDAEVIYQVVAAPTRRQPSAACATTTRRWASTGRSPSA